MKLIVFSKSYFDGKLEVRSHDHLRRILQENPQAHIRIQDVHGRRVLLKPSENGVREIDGATDIVWTVKLFKDCIGEISLKA